MAVERIHLKAGDILIVSVPDADADFVDKISGQFHDLSVPVLVVNLDMNFTVLSSDPDGDDGEEANKEPVSAGDDHEMTVVVDPSAIQAPSAEA